MAQSFDFGGNTFLDASAVEMFAGNATYRKTLADWGNAVKVFATEGLSANASVLMRLAESTVGFVFLCSPAAAASGVYAIGCTSGGVAYCQELVPGSNITITRSSANIRFSNGNANFSQMLIVLCSGGYTVV